MLHAIDARTLGEHPTREYSMAIILIRGKISDQRRYLYTNETLLGRSKGGDRITYSRGYL